MSDRFFSEIPIAGDAAELTGPEAHHLANVMRGKVGDEILLFDGSGAEFAAAIARIGKQRVELRITERRSVNRELPFVLTLAVALPKGDRQKWLVEKCVELGVTQLVPLVTARGVAQPVEQAIERLRRAVIEATKQCGRNRLLQILAPQSAVDFFAHTLVDARFLAEPGGAPLREALSTADRNVVFAVGPEGGFAAQEVASAQAGGWQLISLGSRILRVETAAVALAAYAAFAVAPPSD